MLRDDDDLNSVLQRVDPFVSGRLFETVAADPRLHILHNQYPGSRANH